MACRDYLRANEKNKLKKERKQQKKNNTKKGALLV